MFFVGLAGSIIPYILFTCVMVILTLGANAEVLKKLSIVSEPAKAIVLDATGTYKLTETADSIVNFHWGNHINHQVPASSDESVSALMPPLPQFLPTSLFPPAFSHYCLNYSARYFGLSPPRLV